MIINVKNVGKFCNHLLLAFLAAPSCTRTHLSGPQVVESQLQVQLSGMQRQRTSEQQDGEDGVITPPVEKPASDATTPHQI